MKNRQLAQVGLGLLGVWSLLSAVATFIQVGAIVGASLGRVALAVALPVALMLGISYLLIFHNAKVALAIFPEVEDGATLAEPDFARTLVALTGVMLLVQAAPGALNALLTLLAVGQTDPSLRPGVVRRLIGLAVPVGAGVYLLTRPDRLLEYLNRPAAQETSAD